MENKCMGSTQSSVNCFAIKICCIRDRRRFVFDYPFSDRDFEDAVDRKPAFQKVYV